jgi:hypothetical protein
MVYLKDILYYNQKTINRSFTSIPLIDDFIALLSSLYLMT